MGPYGTDPHLYDSTQIRFFYKNCCRHCNPLIHSYIRSFNKLNWMEFGVHTNRKGEFRIFLKIISLLTEIFHLKSLSHWPVCGHTCFKILLKNSPHKQPNKSFFTICCCQNKNSFFNRILARMNLAAYQNHRWVHVCTKYSTSREFMVKQNIRQFRKREKKS